MRSSEGELTIPADFSPVMFAATAVLFIGSYFLAVKLTELGGVATRRGAFCAHPYVWRLLGIPDDELSKYEDCGASGTPGMIRVSFGIYNTEEEVDEFLSVLSEAIPAAKAFVEEQIEELGEESQAFDPSF